VSTRGRFFLFGVHRVRPEDGHQKCEWIAGLLQHGLLKGSFVRRTDPELRDLNRNRAILAQQRATVSNRIEKVLEGITVSSGPNCSKVALSGAQIARFGQEIEERSQPFSDLVERSLPFQVWTRSQRALGSGNGVDMKQFPTAQHLASWRHVPREPRSAGKNYSGKTPSAVAGSGEFCARRPGRLHTHNTYLALCSVE
jgi:hypothetical protein